MTTGVQLALAGGALVGLGVALLLWRLAPAHPDLADALQRLSPEQTRSGVEVIPGAPDSRQRLGVWALKRLPAGTVYDPSGRTVIRRILPRRSLVFSADRRASTNGAL